MRTNVGKLDRILRALAGVALLLAGLLALQGTGQVVAVIAGLVLLFTGGSGYCPIYGVCGTGTMKPQVRENPRS
ncbi:YgaP family membrane protein [Limnochorda pilosa]|uniref:Inner membrane protein YgaP-like transmembrane domain-containing protein n=1 Tax=Limnochorda pilosa TaxID=1555112 RepID=A0A0K2SHF1_LIMPI|nr:DUF2892 domain-containing protein [Limnochorda pilosa]BAS26543.1 hypothetical protein LIP_0686 [Limnochorda pilosa]